MKHFYAIAIRAGVVKNQKLEKTPKLLPIPNSQFPIPKKRQIFGHESNRIAINDL